MRFRHFAIPLALSVTACEAAPPPRWAEGGAPLVVGAATWRTGDGDVVQIDAKGNVSENGDALFVVDRAGRVYDHDNQPVAILLPDGNVVGNDGVHLGRIGVTNAAPPGSGTAWLAVLPDGGVLYFDEDGTRRPNGAWTGCAGPVLRTCTLVTHIVVLRHAHLPTSDGNVYFGVGVGVGVWH